MLLLLRFSVQRKPKLKCFRCSDFGQKYLAKMPAGHAANNPFGHTLKYLHLARDKLHLCLGWVHNKAKQNLQTDNHTYGLYISATRDWGPIIANGHHVCMTPLPPSVLPMKMMMPTNSKWIKTPRTRLPKVHWQNQVWFNRALGVFPIWKYDFAWDSKSEMDRN